MQVYIYVNVYIHIHMQPTIRSHPMARDSATGRKFEKSAIWLFQMAHWIEGCLFELNVLQRCVLQCGSGSSLH